MADFGKQLLTVLNEIKGGGSFACSGIQPFIFPGLQVRNVDEIGFPINAVQIKEMIKVAHQAPFGKGSQTVLDTAVRSAWEIDAGQIKFNKNWEKFVENVVERVKPDLGLEESSVSAHLYKLLIYKKGDFFVSHKDSEKEPGMFGTLLIGLPAKHTGGELAVRFDGQEEIIDFSDPANQYQIPFAAFYADCEHEIRPVLSGYRVCLVYNLVQSKRKIQPQSLGNCIEKLVAILKASEGSRDRLKIIMLGHQYTPSNFTMGALKLNDRPKAEAIIKAAGKAGYHIKLGLVTSYQTGELEIPDTKKPSSGYGRRRSYYDDEYYDNDQLAENGTMGEVYDEHVDVEHWMEEGVPPLRNIEFDAMDLISPVPLNEGEPIEKSAEGYTGNAGMEMAYWYHYGAAFLWPKKYHYDILTGLDTVNQLEWMDYYNRHWNTIRKEDIEMTKKLVETGLNEVDPETEVGFGPLADWLINLRDEQYLSKKGIYALTNHFTRIPEDRWIKLFEAYPLDHFVKVFCAAAAKKSMEIVSHLLAILVKLLTHDARAYKPFVAHQSDQFPVYLKDLELSDKSEQTVAKKILRSILAIDNSKAKDSATWLKQTTEAFTKNLTREYVNDVLVKEILTSGKRTDLARQIMAVCKLDLKRRVHDQPQPPSTWSRSIPKVPPYHKEEWNILSDFLKSPIQQVFDYQAVQAKRKAMEHAIRSVTVDLKLETIQKGSPHILRLTKTTDAHQRDLTQWKKDVELLKTADDW